MTYRIIKLNTLEEMIEYHGLLQLMYPEMQKKDYERKLNEMLKNDYKQIAAFEGDICVGIAGYWINTRLYCDKYIDIDNVVVRTDFRSKGVGKVMMDWLEIFARKEGCQYSILDAYVENRQAHKFYFREGYIIRGFHFLKNL